MWRSGLSFPVPMSAYTYTGIAYNCNMFTTVRYYTYYE